MLVTHGNRDVVISVTRNEGARISDAGYTTLVDRSINEEVLAICVSMRKDIPQEHFNALIAKASEVVFEKLAASNPHAVYEVHKVLTDITGQDLAGQPKAKRDYREAAAQLGVVRRSGTWSTRWSANTPRAGSSRKRSPRCQRCPGPRSSLSRAS